MENDVAMPPIRAPRTPEARLLCKGKGKEAKLVFMAHALMETRHGLLVDFQTTQATGTAERDTVPVLVDQAKERGFHPKTLGGDKGYDTGDCVAALRQRGLTPHVAQNTNGRSSAIDGRTTRHPGYAISQRIRKRVEEIFGWMKTVGGFRRTRYKGLDRTGLAGYLVATAYNLVRMAKLLGVGQGSAGSPGGMTRQWATHARCPRRAGVRERQGPKVSFKRPIPPNRTNDSQT